MKQPRDYDGTPICLCCGNGWPVCNQVNPETGEKFTHEESCEQYVFADELCDSCERVLQAETT